ncbi:MAG: hypothetical protein COV55_03255 [Candidatus Komeilibacteria bacterium CG11_big_fil_rev_8_21_14_0_20_36_20]|uniref:Thioredoxin domain-containing protein n=1 Tax=Candidatus Komeilibacteria bacterium CG11_big_fil_rev_8_21_14_0_20_36_20 TaxID=1974477 RepID=A0A2H0NEB8_9BACT|nr:MAG: hypothetical protein COV55_03255 [Candidatus Komeilibacteria bacterium CG11_big_fil_rev_8_21_14_0_20_36_20]PIR81636.1 MAG: hypothetical protein COU21_02655 [Candidatus Komeilibacteria bacterium CG10_big_fil_rev_8_21_14_0_10_36_65]PJC55791.1 MAG: hypothetical protein CO027_00035 [Candidatus Komeilibacteria bacterium CG_4_9_14_0_2_um_filter_36_13]
MEESSKKNKGTINNMNPKSAFKAGMLVTLGVVFAIGFFILLGVMIKKEANNETTNLNGNANANTSNVNENQPSNNISLQAIDVNKDWIRGNKTAKVSIVEFSDVDCPYCQKFHNTMQEIMDNYGDDINWVYRHFPLPSLHPDSPKKSEAIECIGEQGGSDKFWEILDIAYEEQPTLSQYPSLVSELGLDVNQFQDCLDSGKYTSKVQQHSQWAQQAGAQGTPYSVIVSGNTLIPIPGALPFSTIQPQLDALVK